MTDRKEDQAAKGSDSSQDDEFLPFPPIICRIHPMDEKPYAARFWLTRLGDAWRRLIDKR